MPDYTGMVRGNYFTRNVEDVEDVCPIIAIRSAVEQAWFAVRMQQFRVGMLISGRGGEDVVEETFERIRRREIAMLWFLRQRAVFLEEVVEEWEEIFDQGIVGSVGGMGGECGCCC